MNALLNRWRPSVVPAVPAPAAENRGNLLLGAGARLHLAERFEGETAQIDGDLCGALAVRNFQLGRNGVFRGHVRCDSAQLRGHFEGELVVRGKLVVFASGRVEGKVRFAEVQVWKGGEIVGNVMRHDESQRPAPPQRHRGALFLPTVAVLSARDGEAEAVEVAASAS